jgi:hypothetical protein
MANEGLPFAQRAGFIAGPAKSGTTLLVSLLDGHPDLLVFPTETAYFPTVLTKWPEGSRRAQFDYLTNESFARVLFGAQPRAGKHTYSDFPKAEFRERFQRAAFDPANEEKDLLVLMIESYAGVRGLDPDRIKRWIEKTPANRDHLRAIRKRFPQSKILLTLRDPRAIMAAQIALERTRRTGRFSVYYVVAHWRKAARLALQIRDGRLDGFVVRYEDLVTQTEQTMRGVCDYLGVDFSPELLKPTKAGEPWAGNSAAQTGFTAVSPQPAYRWRSELNADEIGWIEWHCGDLMPEFGYALQSSKRRLGPWFKPIRGERPKEYLKSRLYSVRQALFAGE